MSRCLGRITTAALMATALTGTLASTATAGEDPAATPSGTLKWGECPPGSVFADSGTECAEFEVPRDYSDPDGEKISLTMSRIKATGERKGVIAGNPGGPGYDALGTFSAITLPEDVATSYDLLAVQPRGLNWSTPLDCRAGLPQDPIGALTFDGGTIRDACEATMPGYVDTITTDNTARDLEEARKLLGEDTLNLYGVSYGGPLMATYATLFPGTTGKVLLDSSVNPDDRWFRLGESRRQARVDAINAFFEWTAARDEEYGLGDTPLKVYRSFSERVLQESGFTAPLTPQPATEEDLPDELQSSSFPGEAALQLLDAVTYLQWRGGTFTDATTDIATTLGLLPPTHLEGSISLTLVTQGALYNESLWPGVASFFASGERPDDSEQENPQVTPIQPDPSVVPSEILTNFVDRAITCNENITAPDPSVIPQYLIGRYTGGDTLQMNSNQLASGQHCAGWPAPIAPARPLSGAGLATAPLNVGFTQDSAVSADGAPGMARVMGGELHLIEGHSHGVLVSRTEDVADVVSAYFR